MSGVRAIRSSGFTAALNSTFVILLLVISRGEEDPKAHREQSQLNQIRPCVSKHDSVDTFAQAAKSAASMS